MPVNSSTLDWDGIVTSTMRTYLSQNFQDQIFNHLILFAWLNAKGKKKLVDGGDFLVEPLMYGTNTTVESFDGLDTIDTQPVDGFTAATFNWKGYAGSLAVSLVDRLKNSGKAKIIDLLEARTKQLEMSFRNRMNTDAFGDGTGNSSKNMLGLGAIVGNSGTLGGIDRATYTWWKAQINSTVEALSTLDRWRTMYNDCAGQETRPDLILTTQSGHEWYESLAGAKLNIDMVKGNPLADLGFNVLKYKGALVAYDEAQTAGYTDFLNSEFMKLRVHSQADFAKTEKKEPTNQLAYVWQLYWFGNLTVSNCRRLGGLRGKTYTNGA